MLVVSACGVLAAGTVWLHQPPWSGWDGAWIVLTLLAISLVLGELRPIPISRGDDSTDQITISTTAAVMLVIVGPIGFALFVQCAAVLFDDLRARRNPLKLVVQPEPVRSDAGGRTEPCSRCSRRTSRS